MRLRSAPGESSPLGNAEHAGAQPLDDSLNNPKAFLDGKAPPVHPGMTSATRSERGTHKGDAHGSEILQNAANLGRPQKA
jgi:hypothetical protein